MRANLFIIASRQHYRRVRIANLLHQHAQQNRLLLRLVHQEKVNGRVGDLLEEGLRIEAVLLQQLDELRITTIPE